MERFVPDIYKNSIYKINFKKLKTSGIKCLLFDLDNTLVSYQEKEPSKKLIDFFTGIKTMGFRPIIITNNGNRRVKPFKDAFEVDCYTRAFKPSSKKFLKIMSDFKLKETEVAMIGDQLFTDILGGNKLGITTILVNPIGKDSIISFINRTRENRLVRKMSKLDLFYRGKYYD